MRTISVFNFVSADGYFAGPHGEIDWFKFVAKDPEYDAYIKEQSSSGSGGSGKPAAGNALLFGRTTYEMMKSYWPTPEAIKNDPGMASVMNSSPKIVISKTLRSAADEPNWKNVSVLHEITPDAIITTLKKQPGNGITILGSGSVVAQLSDLGLIDEYTFLVVPIALGAGKSMFKGAKQMKLKLLETRAFKNGIVMLRYQPATMV